MNLLPKNKFAKVALLTFAVTLLYWAFGVYLIHLLPYENGFKSVSNAYASSIFPFFSFVALSNLYSLISFIWAKCRRNELHPLIAIGPAVSLTLIIIWNVKPYLPIFLPSGSHLQSFNTELWIADDSTIVKQDITTRQKMLGDVVENILPGKSRNEIIRLLGLSSDDSNQPTLNYYLGPARGDFSKLHIEFLKIHFSASGNYAKYSIITDD